MNRLLTSVLCSLVTISTVVTAEAARPKLVVGIVVDQLRTDYVEYLRELFGEKGFRRLMTEGAYLRNIEFPTVQPDLVSATAMLYTGNYPGQNGVPAASVYDESRGKMQPTLTENNTYSPSGLLLSTISDEIAIDGLGLASIYSIAADPQQAVIMAGHAGTSAVWISEASGKWATSPYYAATPQPAAVRNTRRGTTARFDSLQWKPLLDIARYPGISEKKSPFKYSFSEADIRKFIASPMANQEVTDLAIDYLRDLHLGEKSTAMDMLNIGYSAAPYKYADGADNRLELQDTYLRLDRDLGKLLDAIDKYVGLDNTLIYLSSTGYYNEGVTPDAEKFRIPGGTFSVKRAISLLNSYLSASYGPGDYVAGYAAGHFFLNDKAIKSARLDERRLAADARDFLAKMSGIAQVYTLDDILSGGAATLDLRNSIDVKRGGDLYVTFAPGWTVSNDHSFPTTEKHIRSSAIVAPFMMMGPGIEPQVIGTPVEATLLAPTLTQALRIRAPNGAAGRPLLLTSPVGDPDRR